MQDQSRVLWVDAARGVAVLGIVLWHASVFAYYGFVDGAPEVFWRGVNAAVWPFLLPTLFYVSGALRPWLADTPITSSRTLRAAARPFWLYLLWYLIYAALSTAGLRSGVPGVTDLSELLVQFVVPESVLWFLGALALWTLVIAGVRGLPRVLTLALFIALAVASFWFPGKEGVDQYIRVAAYGVFFYLGVLTRERFFAAVAKLKVHLPLIAVPVYAAMLGVREIAGDNVSVAAATFVIQGAAAIVILSYLSAAICRFVPGHRALAWIGERTFAIYVVTGLVYFLFAWMPWWRAALADSAFLQWSAPVLLTALATTVAAVVYGLARRSRVSAWLFELPIRIGPNASKAHSHD